MENTMKGKTLFVVSLLNGNGDYLGTNIKNRLVEGGYTGVALKVCHGNHWNYAHSKSDRDRFVEQVKGIARLYGWHWNEGFDPIGEALIADKAIAELGLEAYMMDYEAPMKERPQAQVPLLQSLREKRPDFPLGLCSYRYPSYHPEILWEEILPFFDFHAPQVYWMRSTNPATQLEKSYNELMALKDMPFFPVGCAFAEGGWQPTAGEMKEFDQKAKDMGLEGVQWFTYRGARDIGAFGTLASLEWPIYPPETSEPADCEQAVADAVAAVEAEYESIITDYETDIAERDQTILDLQAQLSACQENPDSYKRGWNDGLNSLIAPHLKE